MRLQKIFLILALLMAALISAQMLHTLSGTAMQWRGGVDGLNAMQDLRLVLVASEMASRERAPANGMLRDDLPNDPNKIALLNAARQKTNAAFKELEFAFQTDSVDKTRLRTILSNAQRQLVLARQSIDLTASLPKSERTTLGIRASITEMFEVVDVLSPATLQLTNVVQATYPKETNFLLAARAAADLREYAGRLGSYFTVASAKRELIALEDLMAMKQLMGRIEQLRSDLLERVHTIDGNDVIDKATAEMLNRYFETAIPYVEGQLAIGLTDASLMTDATSFGKRYVADMNSIVSLKNALIDEALRNARIDQAEAQKAAYWVIAWTAATFLLLAAGLFIIEFRISRPMRKVGRLIFEISHGNLGIAITQPRYQDEMADVLKSVSVLRDNSAARVALEDERQRLLIQLKEQAATDFLTELPNRRGFFELAEPSFHSLLRQGHPIAIAIYDVDHFKRVNDTYGHDIGDMVLKAIASLSKKHLRSGDLVARHGGEEFLLFMPYCDLASGVSKAEVLRAQIEQLTVALSDGRELKITASFGVDQCLAADKSVDDSIKRCDEKLYLAKESGRNKVV